MPAFTLNVIFFRIDNVIWIYMLTVAKLSPMVADKRVFFSSCYASLSPIFIISSNKKVKSKLVCAAADQEQPSANTQDFSDNISIVTQALDKRYFLLGLLYHMDGLLVIILCNYACVVYLL